MEEKELKNEIAAVLFCIFTGLSVLLLAGWWMTSPQRGMEPDASAPAASAVVPPEPPAASALPVSPEPVTPSAPDVPPVDAGESPAAPTAKDYGATKAQATVSTFLAAPESATPQSKAGLQANREVLNLSAELEKAKNERDSYKIAAETARDKLNVLEELENRAVQLESELKAATLAKAELQTKLDEASSARKELAAKLEAKTADSDKVQESNLSKIKGLEEQVTALKTELEASKKAMTARESSHGSEIAQLKTKIADVEKLNAGMNQALSDLKKQKDELDLKIAALNKEKAELGKTMETNRSETQKKLTETIETMKAETAKLGEERDRLKAQLAALETTPSKMSQDFSARIKILEAENKSLEQKLASVPAMNPAPLAPEINQLKEQNQSLASQVAKLTAAMAEFNTVSAALNKLKEENKKLAEAKTTAESQLSKRSSEMESLKSQLFAARNSEKLKSAADGPALDLPLLVNDPAALDARSLSLFAELRGIADTMEARNELYDSLAKRGKAAPVMQVKFTAGSAEISEPDRVALRKLPEGNSSSKFLVVGYASVEGDPKSNYQLASRRASQVASIIAEGSAKGQVQAVYYGQTRRFSPYDAPNRVVEVWKVDQ